MDGKKKGVRVPLNTHTYTHTHMLHGYYYDPLHGDCLRRVRRTGPFTYAIDGVFGDDEQPRTHAYWSAVVRIADPAKPHVLRVDFSGKPGKVPRTLRATHAGRTIRWEDGNVWRKLYVHAKQLRA